MLCHLLHLLLHISASNNCICCCFRSLPWDQVRVAWRMKGLADLAVAGGSCISYPAVRLDPKHDGIDKLRTKHLKRLTPSESFPPSSPPSSTAQSDTLSHINLTNHLTFLFPSSPFWAPFPDIHRSASPDTLGLSSSSLKPAFGSATIFNGGGLGKDTILVYIVDMTSLKDCVLSRSTNRYCLLMKGLRGTAH